MERRRSREERKKEQKVQLSVLRWRWTTQREVRKLLFRCVKEKETKGKKIWEPYVLQGIVHVNYQRKKKEVGT